MGGSTKRSKQALVRVVWSQPSRRQYSIKIKDELCQDMWMVEWLFLDLIRVSSLQHVQLASANFADLNSWWNSDTISCYVVPPEELHKTKNLKNRCGIRDTSQVWRKVPTNTVFEKTQWCRAGTGKQH